MRTRLHVTDREHDLLVEVGQLLAGLRNQDLVRLLDWNTVALSARGRAEINAERAARKRDLTAVSSSRIANSITRSNNDLWRLAWRSLYTRRRTLRRQISVLEQRCALEPGERSGRVRGYRNANERDMKQRRLRGRRRELAAVEAQIEARRPSICVGGRDRARMRHNLDTAGLTVDEWRTRWDAARSFLTFIGTAGERFGNDTLHVDPATGQVTLNLPAALAHRSNVVGANRLFRFGTAVAFGHRRLAEQWAVRAEARQPLRYRLRFDPAAKRGRGAWYLDASWGTTPTPPPDLEWLRRRPTMGIDLNAGWLAAAVVDASGNPTGRPISVDVPQQGPARRRAGQMRAAVTELLDAAVAAGCASVTIENLDFADTRDTGRETLGRGQRGRRFRRQVANIPTARFRDTLASMAYTRGIAVIAVDAAYTSKWASQHRWQHTINCSREHRCSSHHGAAVVIARRGLGLSARRAADQQSMEGCDCPKPTRERAKARRRGSSRGCAPAPRETSRQPPRGRKTGRRPRRPCGAQRSATPFGATLRAPPGQQDH